MIDLTIIIPTRNRLPSLSRLFASLRLSLSRITASFEIFVVNNGDVQNTAKILELAKTANLKIEVLGPTPGKSWGLNKGLKRAKGRIICPLDDDVVVAPDWAEKLLEAHASTGFDAIQGKILPGVDPEGRAADPERLREYNIPIIDYGEEIREIRGLTGTNGSFKREVQYRKGLSRSIYRHDSIFFNVLPNLLANCIRFVIYKAIGKREKSYKTEGRIMKYWGYLAGRIQQRMGKDTWV